MHKKSPGFSKGSDVEVPKFELLSLGHVPLMKSSPKTLNVHGLNRREG